MCTCSIMHISPSVNSIYQLSFLVAPIHLSQSDFATPVKQSSRSCQTLHLFLSGLFSAVTSVLCTSTLLCSSEPPRNPAQLESIQLKELSSITKVTLKTSNIQTLMDFHLKQYNLLTIKEFFIYLFIFLVLDWL